MATVTISGQDSDLGVISSDIDYTITSDSANDMAISCAINDVVISTMTSKSPYSGKISALIIPTASSGKVVISASVDGASATRQYTYTKNAITFENAGSVSQITSGGNNVFPVTVPEAVRGIDGPMGPNLGTALLMLMQSVLVKNGTLTDMFGNTIHPINDDRYYTEAEVNNLLAGKLPTDYSVQNSIDLNTLTTQGTYMALYNSGVNQTPFHTPYGEATSGYSTITHYNLFVYGSSTRLTQLCSSAFQHNQGLWFREKHDANWSAWKQILTSKTMPLIGTSGWTKIQEYTTAGAVNWTVPDLFGGRSYTVGVLLIGAGGSGAANKTSSNSQSHATGGASGYAVSFTMQVTPNSVYSGIVGAKGASVGPYSANGVNGGSTSFNGIVVDGGYGGTHDETSSGASGANGAQPSYPSSFFSNADTLNLYPKPFGGVSYSLRLGATAISKSNACFNPFENKQILGAGGSAMGTGVVVASPGGKDPVSGLGGGDAVANQGDIETTAYSATSPGCGGGAAVMRNTSSAGPSSPIHSGAGADGAIYIYAMGV